MSVDAVEFLDAGPKAYRVYFNPESSLPHVWSIDEGDTSSEIRVQFVQFEVAPIRTVFSGEAPKNTPKAWVSVFGCATFQRGGVVITRERPA